MIKDNGNTRRDLLPISWRDEDCECHGERLSWWAVAAMCGAILWVVPVVAMAKACGV